MNDDHAHALRRCAKKVWYDTKEAAQAVVDEIRSREGKIDKRLNAFKCKFGPHFHTGHYPKRWGKVVPDEYCLTPPREELK
jgi:hypothetical protein